MIVQVVLSYGKPCEGGVCETLFKWKKQGLGGGEKTSFNLSPSLNESLLLSARHRQGSQAKGHHRRIHEKRKGRYAPGMEGKARG